MLFSGFTLGSCPESVALNPPREGMSALSCQKNHAHHWSHFVLHGSAVVLGSVPCCCSLWWALPTWAALRFSSWASFSFLKLSAFLRVWVAWGRNPVFSAPLFSGSRTVLDTFAIFMKASEALVPWGNPVLAVQPQRYWHYLTIFLVFLAPLASLTSNQTYPFGLQIRPGCVFRCHVCDPLQTPHDPFS